MAIRQADKARGVFVIDMSENNLQESTLINKVFGVAKFCLTGIGDKTEVVVLDREVANGYNNQAVGRLLDRLYNNFSYF